MRFETKGFVAFLQQPQQEASPRTGPPSPNPARVA